MHEEQTTWMQKEITIDLKEYLYNLPIEKIAYEGSSKRDNSSLLFYNKGKIEDYIFKDITSLIPANSTLFFNNTKVIPARLYLQKKTGANIELFLLKPAYNKEISLTLENTKKAVWECMIGNLKKWKEGEKLIATIKLNKTKLNLQAILVNKKDKVVEFSWNNTDISFAQLIDNLGNTPLPPYIKRDLKDSDKQRYQTVYSKVEGAVAAPTAGLHFTTDVLQQLHTKGIKQKHLTLHVGAGTFMPIKSASVQEHPMHNETMIVPINIIESVIESDFTISVGTTSMRTLESLYWFGVKLIDNPKASFKIDKMFPYQPRNTTPTKKEAFEAIRAYALHHKLDYLMGDTEIFIFPGYKFRVCEGLITNFHQPESTLILLIAAFIGDKWKSVYNHALQNNYRFLSFGDSSLLIPTK